MAGKGRIENLKPWPKGVSGNPGGRPRRVITDPLIELLDKKQVGKLRFPDGRTWHEVLLEAVVRNVMKGNAQTILEVWARLEGKVPESPPASDSPLVVALQALTQQTAKMNGQNGQAPKKREPKNDRSVGPEDGFPP
jgi:hypothetical protein